MSSVVPVPANDEAPLAPPSDKEPKEDAPARLRLAERIARSRMTMEAAEDYAEPQPQPAAQSVAILETPMDHAGAALEEPSDIALAMALMAAFRPADGAALATDEQITSVPAFTWPDLETTTSQDGEAASASSSGDPAQDTPRTTPLTTTTIAAPTTDDSASVSLEAPADERAVAAAAELVTLLAEQRTILDTMSTSMSRLYAGAAGGDDERQADHTLPETIAADPQPIILPRPLPLPLPPPPEPVTTSPRALVDDDRPPIIIERAHAEQQAGGTGFAEEYIERPSRLPAFASGFTLAMLIGATLYYLRLPV